VHGQNGFATAAFLDPDEGVGSQPIVGVDEIKAADVIFHGAELVNEGAAHIVDFIDEIRVQREIAEVVMHAVNAMVVRLLIAAAGKNVDFMATPIESGRQLRDVDADSTHGDAVQRLPGKQGNLHDHPPGVQRIRATMIFPIAAAIGREDAILAVFGRAITPSK